MTENYSKYSARDAAGLSHPLRFDTHPFAALLLQEDVPRGEATTWGFKTHPFAALLLQEDVPRR